MKILKVLLFTSLLFLNIQCENKNLKRANSQIKEGALDTIKDIYIGKKIYAGGELYDFVIEKYIHFTQVDSLSYAIYKNDLTKSKDYIFSLEKLTQKSDFEEYQIIDTVLLKNYFANRFQVKEINSANKVIVSLSSNDVIVKEWIFNKKRNLIYRDSICSSWRISCENNLTILDIENNNSGYLSLYSYNPIYINVEIKKLAENANEYEVRFKNIDSQEIYYKDKKKIIEEEISKTEPIARFVVDQNSLTLKWIGLYNVKTKSIEFVHDAVFVRENGGENTIIFKRCKE